MMPMKDLLALKPHVPGPPVIVIDENSIKNCCDAGPVCGCQEKYEMIQNYSPFLPGGINPYKRKIIPDSDCFALTWKNIKIGSEDLLLEKPVAKHVSDLPPNFDLSKQRQTTDDLFHITPPRE